MNKETNLWKEYRERKESLEKAKDELERIREQIRERLMHQPKDGTGVQKLINSGVTAALSKRITTSLKKDAVQIVKDLGFNSLVVTTEIVDEQAVIEKVESGELSEEELREFYIIKEQEQLRITISKDEDTDSTP